MQGLREGRNNLITAFSPDAQKVICTNNEQCYFGDYPTLAKISSAYGIQASVAWLIPQLTDLSEFCGCKGKLTGKSLEECAWLIAQNYYYLKVSELMLFFYRFKQGRYGKFFGFVDPLVIMSSLLQFRRERFDAYFDYESKQKEKEQEATRGKGISYQEYLRLKAERENNNKQ